METCAISAPDGGVTSPLALPRLVYIGDVPVECSYHGSALLYRLLETYPADRLRIVEAGFSASLAERRLPGVKYVAALERGERVLRTRLHRWVSAAFSLRAPHRQQAMKNAVAAFQPQAVLTVAHGYSWIGAAGYARRHGLPLHLIVHDDWPRMAPDVPSVRGWVERQFARCYREAASRFCVSPFMVEEYERRYGTRGILLYPSRAADAPEYSAPPARLCETGRPLVFAFGGTLHSAGHLQVLRELATVLELSGARLHLYGPIQQADAERAGLLRGNVTLGGSIPATDFIARLRAEADVLVVPMSFAASDRGNMSLCFPSKLADYTAAGLPLLILGPDDCSAVRWARENETVAELITSPKMENLTEVSKHLVSDPAHRMRMGYRALEVGAHDFSNAKAQQSFSELTLRAAQDKAVRSFNNGCPSSAS